MEELADLLGARLPGEAPGAEGAAFGAPVGAGALEAVLPPPAGDILLDMPAELDIEPVADDMAPWLLELLGAMLPGEALVAAGALGAPVGAGAEVEVCAIAKPVDMMRAAEANKSDRMCVSCETGLFLTRHVVRGRAPHKKVFINSGLNTRH